MISASLKSIRRSWVPLAATLFIGACGGGGGDDDNGGGGGGNNPSDPVAAFTATPSSGKFPLSVQFDAAGSTAGGGATYEWTFGDGGVSTQLGPVTHVYQQAGSYTATLRVTDTGGGTSSTTRTITVETRTMPNVVGMSQAAATAALAAEGLTVQQIQALKSTEPLGTVIGQEPGPGALHSMAGITLRVSSPLSLRYSRPNTSTVPDTVRVVIFAESIYEITAAEISVGGVVTPLAVAAPVSACPKPCTVYAGDVSLVGQPLGTVMLDAYARDSRGNEASAHLPVVHDNPPKISVVEPLDHTVTLGNFQSTLLAPTTRARAP